jgi:membrane protein
MFRAPDRAAVVQSMGILDIKNATVRAVEDLACNRTLAYAAGLAYYFFLSLFPLMIFMAAALAYVPIPNLFEQIIALMARFVPGEAMLMVQPVIKSVLRPPGTGLLSFGIIGTLWVASSGFSSLIDSLNTAYDVPETRPYWKTRSLAVLLTLVVGSLVAVGLGFSLLGPDFAERLSHHVDLSAIFVRIWPALRWTTIFTSVVLAVEFLYYLAPNVKQRFLFTLPGAVIGVTAWIIISLGFGIYVREFANYNKTYGTLGGVIALMFWFYLSSVAILVGAEINAELIKAAGKKLPVKKPDPVAEAKSDEKIKAVESVEHKYEGKDRRRAADDVSAEKYAGIERRRPQAA